MAFVGQYHDKHYFLVRDFTPRFVSPSVRLSVCLSVHPSIRQSVRHILLCICGLWSYCSCPNDQVTSHTAPVHPHTTRVAVYPALVISDIHPSNSGNWSNLPRHATLAPLSTLFLSIIVVVPLHCRVVPLHHHRCSSLSSSSFFSIIVVVPLHCLSIHSTQYQCEVASSPGIEKK